MPVGGGAILAGVVADPHALGRFLRAHREARDPASVGFAPGSRRRTPGLRREELAAVANLSMQYLTRLEQGVHPEPSVEVLTSLSHALGLDDDAAAHMFTLAGRPAQRRSRSSQTQVPATLARLVDRASPSIASVLNRRRDIVARNAAFDLLLQDFTLATTSRPNLVALIFDDPAARRLWGKAWPQVAADAVAHMREQLVGAGEESVVAGMLSSSPEFTALWSRFDVRCCCTPVHVVVHPVVGELTLSTVTLNVEHGDLQLVVSEPVGAAALTRWADFVAASQLVPLGLVEARPRDTATAGPDAAGR